MITKGLYSLGVILLIGVGTHLYAAPQNDSIKNKNLVDSVSVGKTLYENSCVRCHKLKAPSKYTVQQWPALVNKMQRRSKITDEQKATILKYLLSEAKKQ